MSENEVTEAPTRPEAGPDRFLGLAKQYVLDNYNEHQDETQEPMELGDLYIVWYAKALNHWRAQVQSTYIKGLLWMVTYNGSKGDVYLEVFRKVNNTTVSTRKRPSS